MNVEPATSASIRREGDEVQLSLGDQCSIACGTQWACGGVEEVGVGSQQRSVTGLKGRKVDHVRSIANDFAVFSVFLARPLNLAAMSDLRSGV